VDLQLVSRIHRSSPRKTVLIRYTINTGRITKPRQHAISDKDEAALKPLLSHGGVIAGCAPFKVRVVLFNRGDPQLGGAMFAIWRGGEVIENCALAWTHFGEILAWGAIEFCYLEFSDRFPKHLGGEAPEKPNSLPWLAVLRLPSRHNQIKRDLSQLEKFENQLARLIIKEGMKS
jgi:hypothetical protein